MSDNINKIVQELMENAIEYGKRHEEITKIDMMLDRSIGIYYNTHGADMTIMALREYIKYIRYLKNQE